MKTNSLYDQIHQAQVNVLNKTSANSYDRIAAIVHLHSAKMKLHRAEMNIFRMIDRAEKILNSN